MKFFKKLLNYFFYKLFYLFIVFYQKLLSPLIPARCRYYPTCSNYGRQALAWHGVWAGSWLLLKRMGRCHPLGGHGVDFVPLPLATFCYHYLPSAAQCSVIEDSAVIMIRHRSVYRDYSSYVARLNDLMK